MSDTYRLEGITSTNNEIRQNDTTENTWHLTKSSRYEQWSVTHGLMVGQANGCHVPSPPAV